MGVVREVRSRLAVLEARVAPELRDEVRALRVLLADPERQWIGTVEAQRLLGVKSLNTVKAWARLGLLRSRRGPSGRLKVHLEDVLREARAQRDLDALGGVDELLSPEEWDILAGQDTPEGEAITGEIVRLAAAREGQAPGRRQDGPARGARRERAGAPLVARRAASPRAPRPAALSARLVDRDRRGGLAGADDAAPAARRPAGGHREHGARDVAAARPALMDVVPAAAPPPGVPPSPLRDPRDEHLWNAALNAGAAYVVSHNTRHFPPPVPSAPDEGAELRHRAHGVEFLTAIEFIEDVLGLDAAALYGAPIPPGGIMRSARSRR